MDSMFTLGWTGRRRDGDKVYFVRARGHRVVSRSIKSEAAAQRLADRMNEDWREYMFALGYMPSSSQRLRGFPD